MWQRSWLHTSLIFWESCSYSAYLVWPSKSPWQVIWSAYAQSMFNISIEESCWCTGKLGITSWCCTRSPKIDILMCNLKNGRIKLISGIKRFLQCIKNMLLIRFFCFFLVMMMPTIALYYFWFLLIVLFIYVVNVFLNTILQVFNQFPLFLVILYIRFPSMFPISVTLEV